MGIFLGWYDYHESFLWLTDTSNLDSVNLYAQQQSLFSFNNPNFFFIFVIKEFIIISITRDFLFIIMHVYKAGEEMVVQIWMKKRIEEEEKEEEEEKQRKG